jgi:outer membrane protein TolC
MTAYNRWKQLSENRKMSGLANQASRDASLLLEAIEASFEAGEASLLDYLDVVDAYLSISEEEVQLEHRLRLAAIDLAYSTGTPITRY